MFKSLDDIEILGEKHLGEGAFSEVFKVRHRKDNKTYAMKIVCSQGGCIKDIQRRHRKPETRNQITFETQSPQRNSIH